MTDTASEPAAADNAGAAPAAARPRAAKPSKGGSRPAPPRHAAQQVLERLFELYPKLFGARFLPLKLGVFQELMARHPDEFKKEDLKLALGLHTRSTRYLESVAAGAKRHGLDGMPLEEVAPEHVHHAIMEVFRRRQARSKEDLRPWLQAQLARAIEACGLSREEYTQRASVQDPAGREALDAVFAAIAQQAAKREALRRAFVASGRSVEEFAEMYGLEAGVVRRTLAPGA